MTIYELDDAITSLVDPETGEILDFEAFDNLQMEREKKIEGVCLWEKELVAEAKALKDEADMLTERRKKAESKAESLRKWIAYALNGEKFSTPKCEVTFRRSTAVDVEDKDKFLEWCQKNQRDDLLTFKEPTISKRAVMDALKMGWELPYCRLEERKNVGVK